MDDAAWSEQSFQHAFPPSDGRGSVTRTYHRGVEARKVAFVGLLAGIAAAYGFQRWRPFRVEVAGASMRPTLEPGDWALAVRTRRVRLGDVVVVEHPERPGFELVKRVVPAPGDPAPDGPRGLIDRVWVEGDDPHGSTDSRGFGGVPTRLVKGRVVVVWWPPGRIGLR
jgi:signal peptidase I